MFCPWEGMSRDFLANNYAGEMMGRMMPMMMGDTGMMSGKMGTETCCDCKNDCGCKNTTCNCGGNCKCSESCRCKQMKKMREHRTMMTWRPHADVSETDKSFIIRCDMPGVPKENIKLEVANGMLNITAKIMQEDTQNTEMMHRVERRFGCYCRSFPLQSGLDPSQIKARCEHGVLKIEIPKMKSSGSGTQRITIG